MQDALLENIKLRGRRLTVGANRPVILDRPGWGWLVESGRLEIFVADTCDGRPSGTRRHCHTVGAGGLALGLHSADYGRGRVLVAVGNADTQLMEAPRELLAELGRSEDFVGRLCRLFDEWISALAQHLIKDVFLPETEVVAGVHGVYANGANLRSAKGVTWALPVAGSALYLGLVDTGGAEIGRPLPLTPHTWLLAVGSLEISFADSTALMSSGRIWEGLEEFSRLWFESEAINQNLTSVDEMNRARDKEIYLAHLRKVTAAKLASVLEERTLLPPETTAEGDRLLAACRLVGQAQGMTIKAPPQALSDIPGRDPLADIAKTSHFRTRRVTLRGPWWRGDHGPLLGFTAGGGLPVALLPDGPGRYQAHNPAEQTVTRITEEDASRYSLAAYCFYRPLPLRGLTGRDLLAHSLRGSGRDIAVVCILGSLVGALAVLLPLAAGWVFEFVVPQGEGGLLWQLGVMLLVAVAAGGLFEMTRNLALLKVESRVDCHLLSGVMDHLLTLPAHFFRRFTAGDLADRLMGLGLIRQMLSGGTLVTLLACLFAVGNLAILFYFHTGLALAALGLVLVLLVGNALAVRLQVRHLRESVRYGGRVAGLVLQFLTGIAKLRAAGAEFSAYASWADEFSKQKRWAYKARLVGARLNVFNSNAYLLALIVLFSLITARVAPELSPGSFVAFNAAFAIFLTSLLNAANAVSSILQAMPLYERAKPIIVEAPEISEVKAPPGRLTGEMEISHVFFSYGKGLEPALQDVSLKVAPGEFVAVAGPSGSGKSTLVRLLLGLDAPDSGAVYYNGQELARLDVCEVRRQLGVVLQNSKLVSGNILYNIIGSKALSEEDAWEAARQAGIDQEIAGWPMGMNTLVTAGGASFSGGQRQRLLIARALVGKPRIVIFDEATSAMDNRRQAQVSEALEKLNASRLVIAHRLSTIKNADRIYVLDKGRVVETGTFPELMAKGGLFAKMAARQLL